MKARRDREKAAKPEGAAAKGGEAPVGESKKSLKRKAYAHLFSP